MSIPTRIITNLEGAGYKSIVYNTNPSALTFVIKRIDGIIIQVCKEANRSIITRDSDDRPSNKGEVVIFNNLPPRLLIRPLYDNIELNR
jgi:predicted nuclease of predicted toxin-antitoxin system